VAFQVTMPKMSQTTEEVVLLKWKVRVGDTVKRGDPICEVETDKTTMDVESFGAGTVLEILAGEDETVIAGTVIAVLGEPGEKVAPLAPAPRASSTASPGAPHAPAVSARNSPEAEPAADSGVARYRRNQGGILATPLVRNIAAKRGVDLAKLKGSGARGLITKRDVEEYLARGEAGASRRLTPQQEVVGRNLTKWWTTAPHYYLKVDAAADGLLARRASLKRADGGAASINAFLVRAAARVLALHRRVNSSYRDGELVEHAEVNVGLAVAVGDDLYVPVVRDADRKGVLEIDRELEWLVAKARSSRLEAADLAGGTFTVTNLGMYGIDEFTPIIAPGQAGILAVGRIRKRLDVDDEGRMAVRSLCVLTGAFDHRVLNGAQAALFMSALRAAVEEQGKDGDA